MTKAIFLFSGGLDSMIAVKLLKNIGVNLKGLCFKSLFIPNEFAEKSAKDIGLSLKIIDFTEEQIKIVKKPRFGYGKNLNPCLDCRLLMFKYGKEEMEKEKADFLATGEVLGQRPFSQNKYALKKIEKEAGLEGKILRPLSANLLEETIAERERKIDRSQLFSWQGRSRQRQLIKAKEWGIKKFASPSGGCFLTDPGYSHRLKKMMENWPDFDINDVKLLSLGRHFWENKILFVVGRDKEENKKLEKLFKEKDILVWPKLSGPTILIRSPHLRVEPLNGAVDKAKSLIANYAHKIKPPFEVNVKY
ncbi:MAG: thiamine biosynthesis protein ThiI [Parcubacteria group bacterium ADurb.Bin159]|nr:MAG: thiamine biosynthesis protein ThiI [Parcubacteria group bacterium ADurb.Bin159]